MHLTTINQCTRIAADPAQVYLAFIDSSEHAAFTGANATCDARVGGEFTAWDGYIFGKNLVLDEDRRIVQEWSTTEWPEGYPPSLVEFIFEKMEDGTEVTLVHSGVPESQAEGYRQGWIDFYWKPLADYFDRP